MNEEQMMQQQQGPPEPQGQEMPQEPQGQEMQQEPQGQEQGQEVDPALQKEVEGFVGAISKLIHGPETKGKIYDMLKSAPAKSSVPEAAFQTNIRVAEKFMQKGKKPSMEALFSGMLFATSELAEIGNAGKFFKEPISEQNIQPVVQASLERMVVEGVKRELIDPVEFQEKIEPLLNEQQKQMGLEAGNKTGVPAEPGPHQAMEAYAGQAIKKDRQNQQRQQQVKTRQGMMQQAAQGGGQ